MKLKDLIFNREKLRKYDELKEWKEYFDNYGTCLGRLLEIMRIPDYIKQIIIDAIDAEIKKLEEE